MEIVCTLEMGGAAIHSFGGLDGNHGAHPMGGWAGREGSTTTIAELLIGCFTSYIATTR